MGSSIRPMVIPIRFPTVSRDWLLDAEAASQLVGIGVPGIRYHLTHECEFPRPVEPVQAAEAITLHPDLRPSFAELFRRAGSRGYPMQLFLQSKLLAWKALQEAGQRK